MKKRVRDLSIALVTSASIILPASGQEATTTEEPGATVIDISADSILEELRAHRTAVFLECLEKAKHLDDCLPRQGVLRPPLGGSAVSLIGGFSRDLGIGLGDGGPLKVSGDNAALLNWAERFQIATDDLYIDACATVDPMEGFICVSDGKGGFIIVPEFGGGWPSGPGYGMTLDVVDGVLDYRSTGQVFEVVPQPVWGSLPSYRIIEVAAE